MEPVKIEFFCHFAFVLNAGRDYINRAGIINAPPGSTEQERYNAALDMMREQMPALREAVVLSYSIKPNQP